MLSSFIVKGSRNIVSKIYSFIMDNISPQSVEYPSDDLQAGSSFSGAQTVGSTLFRVGKRKLYKCEKCPYTTRRRSDLNRHNEKCSGEKTRGKPLHECRFCGYSTPRSNDLKRHKCRNSTKCYAVKRNGETLYECGRCGYSTRRSSDLKRHKLGRRCRRRHRFTEDFWEGPWCVYSTT